MSMTICAPIKEGTDGLEGRHLHCAPVHRLAQTRRIALIPSPADTVLAQPQLQIQAKAPGHWLIGWFK